MGRRNGRRICADHRGLQWTQSHLGRAPPNNKRYRCEHGDPPVEASEGLVIRVVHDVRPGVVKVRVSTASVGPFGIRGETGWEQGTGTGVLLDDQGHVLTNNHVVTLESSTAPSSISVTLANGKSVNAQADRSRC